MTTKRLKHEVNQEKVSIKLANMNAMTDLRKRTNIWFIFIKKVLSDSLSEEEAELIVEQAEKIAVILEPDQKTFTQDFADMFSEIRRPLLLADEDNLAMRIYEIEQRLEKIINPENYPDVHVEKCSLISLRAIIKQNQVEITQLTRKRLSSVIS
jgi:hypothetical protein